MYKGGVYGLTKVLGALRFQQVSDSAPIYQWPLVYCQAYGLSLLWQLFLLFDGLKNGLVFVKGNSEHRIHLIRCCFISYGGIANMHPAINGVVFVYRR